MAAVNKTSAAKVRSMERQVKALELRRSGMSYHEIAAALGIGKSQAQRYVQAGLASAREQVAAEASDLRAEEVSRLDGMLRGLWPDARKGHLGAVEKVLKIMERRAKLLGLDAPTRIGHGGDSDAPPIKSENMHHYSDEELDRIIATAPKL